MPREYLITRFGRALTGRASSQKQSLRRWLLTTLEDSSLLPLSDLSPNAQLNYVLELARIRNEQFNALVPSAEINALLGLGEP